MRPGGGKAIMKRSTAPKTAKAGVLGKLPVVILPLEDYQRMAEDLEMFSSKTLPRRIEKARKEVRTGRVLTLAEVKKKLRLL